MANKKICILLGALFLAVLGAAPASAGVAIDNAVMLDPYDPVPPVQFSHWYSWYSGYGGCYSECGHRCWHSCYHHADCGDGCYRHRDCDEGCYRNRCEHDCYDRCEGRDCYAGYVHRDEAIAAPCTTGDCYESEHWEHRWRDGDHVSREWLKSGRREGERLHYDPRGYEDDDYDNAPPPH